MKAFVTALFFLQLISINVLAQQVKTCSFLIALEKANGNPSTTDSLFNHIQQTNYRNQEHKKEAYLGVLEAMKGKHALNPFNKYKYVKNGVDRLSRAIKLAPENLELRFLRFSLEDNIPLFLNMSRHLDEDKKKILSIVKHVSYQEDTCLSNAIFHFANASTRFTNEDLDMIKAVLYADK